MKIGMAVQLANRPSSAIQLSLAYNMNKGVEEHGTYVHPHPSIMKEPGCMRMLWVNLSTNLPYLRITKCFRCVDNVCTPLEHL